MKFNVVIIGCGGTGGNLIARLARFMTDYDNRAHVSVTIVDEDSVEMKNISRQVFDYDDIGKNKAVALASNLEACFGVKFKAYTKYITSASQISGLFADMRVRETRKNDEIDVLIGCVDNHAARKVCSKWFESSHYGRTCFYLDSANETTCGEIVIAKHKDYKIVAPDRFFYFPTLIDNIGKPVTEMSCEELNQVQPQHFGVNCLAADNLFNYLTLMLMNPDESPFLKGGICHFNSWRLFSRFDPFDETQVYVTNYNGDSNCYKSTKKEECGANEEV